MKNRRGSTFIITLMVFVFLFILATSTLSFMVSENKQSIVHKDGIEAYYIARSGAEATEVGIRQVYDKQKKLKLLVENIDEYNKLTDKKTDLRKKNADGELDEQINAIDIKIDTIYKEIEDMKDDIRYLIEDIDTVNNEDLLKKLVNTNETIERIHDIANKNTPKKIENTEIKSMFPDDGSIEVKVYLKKDEKDKVDKKDTEVKNPIIIESTGTIEVADRKSSKTVEMVMDEITVKEGVPPRITEIPLKKLKDNIKGKFNEVRKNIAKGHSKYKEITKDELLEEKLEDGMNYYVNGNLAITDSLNIENKKINIFVKGEISIKSNSGTITINGNIYGDDDIEIESNSGTTTINGNIYGTDDIEIIRNDHLKIEGNIYGTDGIKIESNSSMKIEGNIYGADGIKIESNSSIKIEGNIYGADDIKIEPNSSIEIRGDIYDNYDGGIGIETLDPETSKVERIKGSYYRKRMI